MIVPVASIVAVAVLGILLAVGNLLIKRPKSSARQTGQKESRGMVAKNFRSMWNTHQDKFELIATDLENQINQRMLRAAQIEGDALRQKFDTFVRSIKDDQPGDSPASNAKTPPPPQPVAPAPAFAARVVGEPIRPQPGS